MSLSELRDKRAAILELASRHGAGNVRVFGSVVRGEDEPGSDLDLLVDVVGPASPWFPGGLVTDLEDLLGRKVDVVTERSLYWLLRRRILKEAVPL
ncbi:MAG: nucleotidyltransferase family protein [Deinococcota bacterium]|nr:nucleotidyltransferase family protein [Deinococcota bacterium]